MIAGSTTATQYFSRLTDNKFIRVRNGTLPDLSIQDCVDQKDIVSQILHPELEHAPFAMEHGDLSPSNIIVDSQYNVTG
jgi:RIO-like serine/threonine protein kinase